MNLGIGPHDHGIDFKHMDEIDKLNPEVQTPWYRHRHEQRICQVDPWFCFPLHSMILSVDATPTSLRFFYATLSVSDSLGWSCAS